MRLVKAVMATAFLLYFSTIKCVAEKHHSFFNTVYLTAGYGRTPDYNYQEINIGKRFKINKFLNISPTINCSIPFDEMGHSYLGAGGELEAFYHWIGIAVQETVGEKNFDASRHWSNETTFKLEFIASCGHPQDTRFFAGTTIFNEKLCPQFGISLDL